jgi:mannose-6-phosphate isomerase-like protein (cupin superfamily)
MNVFRIDSLPLYEADSPNTRLNKILVDGEACSAANLSVGIGIYRKGEGAEMHVHDGEEEVMVFTKGRGIIALETGTPVNIEPGTVTYVPPGEKHQIKNVGDDPLEFFFIYSPPGPERNIRKWKTL